MLHAKYILPAQGYIASQGPDFVKRVQLYYKINNTLTTFFFSNINNPFNYLILSQKQLLKWLYEYLVCQLMVKMGATFRCHKLKRHWSSPSWREPSQASALVMTVTWLPLRSPTSYSNLNIKKFANISITIYVQEYCEGICLLACLEDLILRSKKQASKQKPPFFWKIVLF